LPTADAVFAKAAWRLIPFLGMLYVANFLDRVNVGFAALAMNRDLGLSPEVYGFGAGIFFIGYFLCEVPSNLALERLGARLWIFRIMLSWGIVSAAMAFARGPVSFAALRFLLGVCEAGFFPGIMLYLTYWFPQSSRARFNAMFLAAIPVSSVLGSPLSGAILGMNGFAGLHGWQWLFLFEGLPSCLLGFVVLGFLADGPAEAKWLTADEKRVVLEALARDAPPHGTFRDAICDPRLWLLALGDFGIVLGTYGLVLWLPQIVSGMGYSNMATGFIVALPYAAALVAMLAFARSSDARNERVWHTACAALAAAAGLLGAAVFHGDAIRILALTVAAMGIYSALVTFWTLPQSFLGGTAAAAGIALVNSIGNLGGFAGPYLMGWLKQSSGGYGLGLAALAAGLMVTAVLVLAMSRALTPDRAAMMARSVSE
jgi:ACS family tartrate transporter-like MFS transporter